MKGKVEEGRGAEKNVELNTNQFKKRNCLGPSQGRIERGGENQTECWEKEDRVMRRHLAMPETEVRQNLAGKPKPCGDTQINRNELN